METLKLIGEQIDEITVVANNLPYKNGQRAKDGKTYSRLRYNGIVFTVDGDSPFVVALEKGDVASVKLIPTKITVKDADGNDTAETVPGLTFDSFVSLTQRERRMEFELVEAKHAFKVNRFKALETAAVTDDLISALTA